MRPVAIIDIDTTIANNDHRAVHLRRKCVQCHEPMAGERGQEKWPVCACGSVEYKAPQDAWDRFLDHDLILQDSLQPHALDVMNKMRELHWKLVFLTGRNEKLRAPTEKWLDTHVGWRPKYEPLLMRHATKHSVPASQMKEKLFLEFASTTDIVNPSYFFFEDDRFVLGTWQKYGMVFLCPDAWEVMNPVVHDISVEPSWNR